MRDFAERTELEVWYAKLDEALLVEQVRRNLGRKAAPNLERNLAKARSKDHVKAFSKLTTVVDGEARILADPPLLVPLRDLLDPRDAERTTKEMSTRCSGPTGAPCSPIDGTFSSSTGWWTRPGRWSAWAASGLGAGSPSSWVATTPIRCSCNTKRHRSPCSHRSQDGARWPNEGERVVRGQRLMQASSDIFLGWMRGTGLDNKQTRLLRPTVVGLEDLGRPGGRGA